MDKTGTLSGKQKRAIAAILAARSITEAAEISGIARRTLYRYLSQDSFRNELQKAESEILACTGRRLLQEQLASVDALAYLRDSAAESVRLQAARCLLEQCLKWRENVNLEERISKLEMGAENT